VEGEIMSDYITDAELLKLLNSAPADPSSVVDPAILAQLNGAPVPAAPQERGVLDRLGHAAGITYRAAGQGLASGVIGLPALVADSVYGVGRDLSYGGKYLLSKTGAVEAPDPKNYYGENNFPLSTLALKAGAAVPDALGLPKPQTPEERIVTSGVEGLYSAATGAGLGAAMLKAGIAPTAATVMATGPKSQAAAGALGGVGSQAAAEEGITGSGQVATGVAASLLPMLANLRSGRVTSATPAGQSSIAGKVLREVAEDPATALRNLDTAGNTRISGFQHFGSNASKDLGIAAVHAPMRQWANLEGGAAAALEEANSSVLSRALDRMGAAPGTADATRRMAETAAEREVPAMRLGALPNIDITHIISDLERASNLRNRGVRSASAEAAEQMRERLVSASRPVYSIQQDGSRQLVGYRINPENLHNARLDFVSPPPAGSGNDRLSGVRYAGQTGRDIRRRIDEELNVATGGMYSDYLGEQRAIRGAADAQGFMSDIANKSSRDMGANRTRTGDREIIPGSFLASMSELRTDKPIAGGKRSMSVERLDPMRRSFLEGVAGDLQDANFVNQRGIATRGSNTQQIQDLKDRIAAEVATNRGPVAKTVSTVLPFLDAATSGIGRIMGPGAHMAARSVVGRAREGLTGRAESATQAVQRQLGMAEVDPAYMAMLMRQPVPYRPTVAGMAGRGALRAGQFGIQGFLAGERTERYR
jgi:hypothetical protein